MAKNYPLYVDVVETPEADFLINWVRNKQNEKTAEEYVNDYKKGKTNTSDRILADYPVDGFAFESLSEGMSDRFKLSQVNARVLSTNSLHPKPYVIISDIGWPRGNPEQLRAISQSSIGVVGPLGLGALLASTSEELRMPRRNFLGIAGLSVLGASIAMAQETPNGQVDYTKLWGKNPYIVDGRSAYHALTYKAMAGVIRERKGLERKSVIAINEGLAHKKGVNSGYGLPDLLTDEDKLAEILQRDRELIRGGLNAHAAPFQSWIWLYEFSPALKRYSTVHLYRPEGEITKNTKFVHDKSWTPKAKE